VLLVQMCHPLAIAGSHVDIILHLLRSIGLVTLGYPEINLYYHKPLKRLLAYMPGNCSCSEFSTQLNKLYKTTLKSFAYLNGFGFIEEQKSNQLLPVFSINFKSIRKFLRNAKMRKSNTKAAQTETSYSEIRTIHLLMFKKISKVKSRILWI